MQSLQVIDDPGAAFVALDPIRSRLAARTGMPRQKINYHLRALEQHGLVQVAEKRKWGGLTESLFVSSAASYMVSPMAMGPVAADPSRTANHLSASYLIALAARIVREVKQLIGKAHELDKRLPTLSIEAEICFQSAERRAAFTEELGVVVRNLAAKYHTTGGRAHRLIAIAHPLPISKIKKESMQ